MKITGQQEIADMFGVSRETINTWQDAGMPVQSRGGPGVPSEFDSAACITWRVESELLKARGDRPQDRLARAQAEKVEMDNATRRRVLIPAEELEPKLKAAFVFARETWLDAVPRLARDLPADPDERERLLQIEFEAFLHKLADWGKAGDEEEDET